MRNCVGALVLALCVAPATMAKPPQQESKSAPPPAWAYGFNTPVDLSAGTPKPAPAGVPEADDGTLRQLPGSTFSFTLTQIRDGYGPADWYPGDHPPMPEIVARGKKPEVRACGLCHYPNGKGRTENAGIAGLSYDYILQQMAEFKNGERKSADPRKPNTQFMIDFAKAMTDDEMRTAARYFSSMKWTPWIKVIETETVPKTRIQNGMFIKLEGDATEPIGQRIIESPVNAAGDHGASRPAIRIYRLRAGGQYQKRRGARHEGRRRQNNAMHHLPCRRSAGPRPGPGTRRPLPHLSRPPALRHPERQSFRSVDQLDETRRRQSDDGRHGGDRRLSILARGPHRFCEHSGELGGWTRKGLVKRKQITKSVFSHG